MRPAPPGGRGADGSTTGPGRELGGQEAPRKKMKGSSPAAARSTQIGWRRDARCAAGVGDPQPDQAENCAGRGPAGGEGDG
eukprot:11958894-Heterocapsa_arctica.AAC.1